MPIYSFAYRVTWTDGGFTDYPTLADAWRGILANRQQPADPPRQVRIDLTLA